MEFLDPVARVRDEELTHRRGVIPVEVECVTPFRALAAHVAWCEARQIVAVRSEMIVDNVEDHAEPFSVRGVYESAEIVRRPIEARWGEQVDAVVAPAEATWEIGDRHDFDRRNADVREVIEPLHRGAESPLRRKSPDMQLVEHLVAHVHAGPLTVGPTEACGVDHCRRAVRSIRLKTGHGIGKRIALVETEAVFRSGLYILDEAGEISVSFRVERRINRCPRIVLSDELDYSALWCPNTGVNLRRPAATM